jgi:hypothetical protein
MNHVARMPKRFNDRSMALMGIPDLPESAFGGDLPPSQRTALVRMIGIKPQGGGGGGGFKKVISVAAVIAIPFVAPAIASSIGLSAVIGSTAGSALVGAGLGAANASLTGGDVERGAIMGGLGGGIAGYNYVPTPTTPAPVFDYDPTTNTMVPAPGFDGATTAAAFDPVSSSYTNVDAQQAAGLDTSTAAFDPVSSSYTNVDAQQAAGLDTSTAAFDPVSSSYTNVDAQRAAGFNAPPNTSTAAFDPVSSDYTNVDAQRAAGGTQTFADGPMGPPAPPGSTVVGATTTVPMTFAEAVRAVPGEIAAKFSDPKALADMTLRAAGALAGSLSAGDGMSDEEKRLLQAQTDELRALQESNKMLFDQKLQAAQDLIGESKYFNPEYFGLQRARRAQLAGAKAKRAGLRGLKGSRRASEERRFDLATGRETGTAFDQGFGAGVTGRTQTLQAGLTAMPGMQTGYGGDYKNIYDQYTAADRRSKERAQGIGDLFGSITGTSKARA